MKCLNEQNVASVVKRVDNVHTCSNEVLPSDLHQVRSVVVIIVLQINLFTRNRYTLQMTSEQINNNDMVLGYHTSRCL